MPSQFFLLPLTWIGSVPLKKKTTRFPLNRAVCIRQKAAGEQSTVKCSLWDRCMCKLKLFTDECCCLSARSSQQFWNNLIPSRTSTLKYSRSSWIKWFVKHQTLLTFKLNVTLKSGLRVMCSECYFYHSYCRIFTTTWNVANNKCLTDRAPQLLITS